MAERIEVGLYTVLDERHHSGRAKRAPVKPVMSPHTRRRNAVVYAISHGHLRRSTAVFVVRTGHRLIDTIHMESY